MPYMSRVEQIPEYWLIDLEEHAIAVLQLNEGNYLEVGRFAGSTQIQSPELSSVVYNTPRIIYLHSQNEFFSYGLHVIELVDSLL